MVMMLVLNDGNDHAMVMIIMMLVIDGDRIELNKMVVMTVD